MGVPETVMDSIFSCPEETIPHLLSNIIVVGGCALFPGMRGRLLKELRALSPDDINVNVTIPDKYVLLLIVFLAEYKK